MHSSSEKTVEINIVLPPNKLNLTLNLIVFFASLLMVVTKMEFSSFRYDATVFLVVSTLLFLSTGRNYAIDKHYLTVKLFCFSIRKIPLSDIQQVIYLSQWNNGKHIITDGIFFITLCGCDRFLSEYDHVMSFSWRHPIRSMFAYVPQGKESEYLDTLTELLGSEIVLK